MHRMTRYRVDAKSAAVGIPLTVYLTALSLLALWFYALLQPRQFSNPGLAAYTPPPGTVVSDVMPARLLAQHWQAPPSPNSKVRQRSRRRLSLKASLNAQLM